MYQTDEYLGNAPRAFRTLVYGLASVLRPIDVAAAKNAARYLVNSSVVQERVQRTYGRSAEILHPPVSLIGESAQAVAGSTPGYVLTVSRLLPYKNINAVLRLAAHRPNLNFVIVGDGPEYENLRRIAGDNVRILRTVSDPQLRWLYANAACLLAPSYEDFGLTPVEANLFRVPVAALRGGGYLDTVVEGVNGSFFDDLSANSISATVEEVLNRNWDRERIEELARQRFGAEQFRRRIQDIVDEVLAYAPKSQD